jgi:DNA-binding MarR family transcriptional regulator
VDPVDLVLALAATTAAVTRRYDRRLSAHGLSFSDLVVLHHLATAPDNRLRRVDLADRMSMSPSGVTRMLLPLEKIGLVAREANPRDARVALATLTDAGRRVVSEALQSTDLASAETFDGWTDGDRQKLADLLVRLA